MSSDTPRMPPGYDAGISHEPEIDEFPVCTQHPLSSVSWCPGCRARRAAEDAGWEQEIDAEVARLVTGLPGHLLDAEKGIRHALVSLAGLTNGTDTELSETYAGEDAEHELEAALRHLRHVHRIVAERLRILEG